MELIKKLREETGLSFAEIKKALDAANGDEAAAREALAARSAEVAAKKADREIAAGIVGSYVHSNGTSGALVLLGCETDFVANNDEFKALARDLAMHACAMMPETVEDMLAQPFVKDGEKTVKQKLDEAVQKFGENTQLVKISRVSI